MSSILSASTSGKTKETDNRSGEVNVVPTARNFGNDLHAALKDNYVPPVIQNVQGYVYFLGNSCTVNINK